jgi:hypothetical protein
VQMFGQDVCGDSTYLYLEHAASFSPWPWSDTALSASVCRELAQLHDASGLSGEVFSWNYDEELIRSAEDTLDLAATARNLLGRRVWRRLGDLRRVVEALPRIRRRLLSDGSTGRVRASVHRLRMSHPGCTRWDAGSRRPANGTTH